MKFMNIGSKMWYECDRVFVFCFGEGDFLMDDI